MCGGNAAPYQRRPGRRGLSPRVRGKLQPPCINSDSRRSIPACAGETYSAQILAAAAQGLSPRVRGKQRRILTPRPRRRSIPACAGETGAANPAGYQSKVYPRVCGGNFHSVTSKIAAYGLSPRVRGKRNGGGYAGQRQRSIPACAGETNALKLRKRSGRVYPRVCGGNASSRCASRYRWGLSPRVRGKRRIWRPAGVAHRSIPACAGETLTTM